jgi:hypothetical protein
MILSSVRGSRNERGVKSETFLFLEREGLTKALLSFVITETDSTLFASQSFEISSSVALGIPSLYFGKDATAVIFIDS